MFHKSPDCGQPTRNRLVKYREMLLGFPAFLRFFRNPRGSPEKMRDSAQHARSGVMISKPSQSQRLRRASERAAAMASAKTLPGSGMMVYPESRNDARVTELT